MKQLKFETQVDGNIEFFFDDRRNRLMLEIDHPWDGDSETGFGRILTDQLSQEQTEQLYWWLKGQLGL